MIYSFDNYVLDTESRELFREGIVIELTPKVFQTLLVLVENHDRVMSKDELLNTIWPDQFVEEANIIQNISVLRKALGETVSGKRYITTFPGRGYKFQEPLVTLAKRTVTAEAPVENIAERKMQSSSASSFSDLPATDILTSSAQPRKIARYGIASVLVLTLVLLGVAAYQYRNKTYRQAHSTGVVSIPSLRTLARMDGSQYEPEWSRDGKYLAFVYRDLHTQKTAIYIQTRGDLQPRLIVSGLEEYSSPSFSPDSRYLAYVSSTLNTAELVILDLTNSKSRILTKLFPHRYGLTCRHMDWAPTGDLIAVDDKGSEGDPLSIYLVYVSNGERIRLTYPGSDIIGDTVPRFSPDGRELAFIRIEYLYLDDVYVVPVTGGEPRRATTQSNFLGDVDWVSNQDLVYSSNRDGDFRLWRLSLALSHPQPALSSVIETDLPLQFSISATNGEIAFSGYWPDLNIWSAQLSKDFSASSTWSLAIHTPGQDVAPTFSSDGSEIAFRSDVSGNMQLWTSRADGSHASIVNTLPLIPAFASWNPNGRALVFSPLSVPGIYEVSLEGSRKVEPLHVLSSGATLSPSHPCYSVDGKWIYFRSANSIYRIPAGGGSAQRLTDQGGPPIRESADGRYLFFGQTRMNTTISMLNLATGAQNVVVRTLIPGYRDSWALTQRGILFLGEWNGKPTIVFHDLASGRENKVTDFPGPLPPVATASFTVSPDGRTLLLVRADPAFVSIKTAKF